MKTISNLLSIAALVGLCQVTTVLAQEAADAVPRAPAASLLGAAPQAAVAPQQLAPQQLAPQQSAPQQSAPQQLAPKTAVTPGESGELRFNFSGTNWRDVLEWLAEQADLSLQINQLPIGTFTFADPTRSYNVSEALDVINLALMNRGYALVRRGRMIQVIDLEIENANKLISEIAELVKPDQLETRGNSDIVSCVFPLGSLTPDAAKEELEQLRGPWGRVVVLDSARQVKVTDTGENLIAIREVLESAATADTNVIEIVLKDRGADELLEIARPLLGLEAGENSGDDIRISVGLYGDRIYAAGLPGKTGLLEAIIEKADQPLAMPDSGDGSAVSLPEFGTHIVNNADVATVFDVLQTLLAGTPEARIAVEPKTKAIVASARPETHAIIEKSIAEMEGSGQEFKVIDLKRLDPAQTLLTINKFFGVTEEGGEGPIVDGDPATGKLWIRGTADQIAKVEKLLAELEGVDTLGGLGDKVRILPFTGRAAEDALLQVESLWPVTGRRNQIRTLTPARGVGGSGSGGIPERRVIREPDARAVPPVKREVPRASEANTDQGPRYYFVNEQDDAQTANTQTANTQATNTQATNTQLADSENGSATPGSLPGSLPASSQATVSVGGADIVIQFTPAGMIIASEDIEALDAFQTLLESIAAPSALQSDLPTIIWLKYIKADVAAEMISSVLGGADSSISSAVDTVTGGLGGGMLGFLGMGGGGGGETSSAKSILTSTGSVNIVSDARLNALIVHANPIDLQMIELVLEKLDRQESPEDIETVAKPELIPVIYQDAKDVAEVVKSVFGDRIEGAQSSGARGGGGGGGGQPSPQDFINALRGGGGGGRGGRGGDAPASEATKISIAVDAKSNSLVVIATPQDFNDVQQLVEKLDQSSMISEETILTYPMSGSVNPEVMKLALESILGTQAKSTTDSSTSSPLDCQQRNDTCGWSGCSGNPTSYRSLSSNARWYTGRRIRYSWWRTWRRLRWRTWRWRRVRRPNWWRWWWSTRRWRWRW